MHELAFQKVEALPRPETGYRGFEDPAGHPSCLVRGRKGSSPLMWCNSSSSSRGKIRRVEWRGREDEHSGHRIGTEFTDDQFLELRQ